MTVDPAQLHDGYHSMAELYRYRTLYHALWVNAIHAWDMEGGPSWTEDMDVHKSWKHHDGAAPFGGGWFIVVVQLPTGQISNHYPAADWDRFQVPVRDRAAVWDGHTPEQAADRMAAYLDLTANHERNL